MLKYILTISEEPKMQFFKFPFINDELYDDPFLTIRQMVLNKSIMVRFKQYGYLFYISV